MKLKIIAEQILFENRIDFLKEKFKNVPETIFDKFIDTDPTSSKIYLQWILTRYVNSNKKDDFINDLHMLNKYLILFDKFKSKLPNKDINKIKTVEELFTLLRTFVNSRSNTDQIKTTSLTDIDKVYEDSKWLVVVPKTKEAAIYYGKGTEWCTSSALTKNAFDTYNKLGKLYIIINKHNAKEKYQLHFEKDEFVDATNDSIQYRQFLDLNDGLKRFFMNIRHIDPDFFNAIGFTDIKIIKKIKVNTKIFAKIKFESDYDVGYLYFDIKDIEDYYKIDKLQNIIHVTLHHDIDISPSDFKKVIDENDELKSKILIEFNCDYNTFNVFGFIPDIKIINKNEFPVNLKNKHIIVNVYECNNNKYILSVSDRILYVFDFDNKVFDNPYSEYSFENYVKFLLKNDSILDYFLKKLKMSKDLFMTFGFKVPKIEDSYKINDHINLYKLDEGLYIMYDLNEHKKYRINLLIRRVNYDFMNNISFLDFLNKYPEIKDFFEKNVPEFNYNK